MLKLFKVRFIQRHKIWMFLRCFTVKCRTDKKLYVFALTITDTSVYKY